MAIVNPEEVRALIVATVHETLLVLGIDSNRPLQMQADFEALRNLRQTLRSIRITALLTIIGLLISGAATVFLVGLKMSLHQ